MPKTTKQARRRYFVNPGVQGAIVRQALLFWLLGLGVLSFVLFAFRMVPIWLSDDSQAPTSLWHYIAPAVVAVAALLPAVLCQAIHFSHRFVGPMIRFRRTIQDLADGKAAPPIRLRQHDFWGEFADDLNRLSARLKQDSERVEQPEEQQELVEC